VDEIAVINASPLIFLSRGEKLALLREFAGRIFVPSPVAREVSARGNSDITARSIANASWIEVVPSPPISDAIASWGLGPGESSVLAVAAASPGMTAIIDDLGGRKCAACLGIPVRGTLGIVLEAKRRGVIPRARPVLEDLIASGLYLRRHVLDEALRRVGE
jgi:predicted nucleic acid-binding protein